MKKIILAVTLAMLVVSCATSRKVRKLTEEKITFDMAMSGEEELPEAIGEEEDKDTISVVDSPEDEMFIMNAIKDENGEMVATDVIKPAKVTARFKNVAERNGKVDIAFDITIFREMLDSRWQIRIRPSLKIQDKVTALDSILITGSDYRNAQMRGYEQYQRFLDSITADSSKFVNTEQLERFLARNLPEIYRFKSDSSYVTDEEFTSFYGITEQEALEHYTNKLRIRRNARKISRKKKMYQKYVKMPIVTDGLKLDTVMTDSENNLVYRYLQTINTHPGLKKAEVTLSGAIYEQNIRIYDMPPVAPLTFYISSLTSFVDHSEHYLTEIVYRKAEVNTACYIDFDSGRHLIDTSLGHNADELRRIEKNLKEIVDNSKYDLDSIIVTASCSPEGSYRFNRELSQKRANSISRYFGEKIQSLRDSVTREKGIVLDLDGHLIQQEAVPEVALLYKNIPENWEALDRLVSTDENLTSGQKDAYFKTAKTRDLDRREAQLKKLPFYLHLRQKLYPRVRTVLFNFYIHRKNMIKDTVHTTVLDTTYLEGVKALTDRDYESAIRILRPYADFNTALAYCALDYNQSALSILERLKPDNKVKYMLAIVYSRIGEEKKAVQIYKEVCAADHSYVNRGNLDPEISFLIKKHGLNPNF